MRPKLGRKSFFTPEGEVALMFLKMYTGLSCQKLMGQLNVFFNRLLVMNRAMMMQLVDALNKAVASGDRGSMFRRTWGTYATGSLSSICT